MQGSIHTYHARPDTSLAPDWRTNINKSQSNTTTSPILKGKKYIKKERKERERRDEIEKILADDDKSIPRASFVYVESTRIRDSRTGVWEIFANALDILTLCADPWKHFESHVSFGELTKNNKRKTKKMNRIASSLGLIVSLTQLAKTSSGNSVWNA